MCKNIEHTTTVLKLDVVVGTYTMRLFRRRDIPQDWKIKYATLICEYRAQKLEQNQLCINICGNLIDQLGDVGTKMENMTTINCMLISVVSNMETWFMKNDVKNFYLDTSMDWTLCMCTPLNFIPENIIR